MVLGTVASDPDRVAVDGTMAGFGVAVGPGRRHAGQGQRPEDRDRARQQGDDRLVEVDDSERRPRRSVGTGGRLKSGRGGVRRGGGWAARSSPRLPDTNGVAMDVPHNEA